MPTYEYACKQCGEHLDVVQRFTDDALTTCPSCAGSLRKVFGTIGISFKGSGFYKNDSRSSSNGKQEKGEKTEKADKTGKADGSSSDKAGLDKAASKTQADGGGSSPNSDAAKPKKADAPTAAP